MNYKSTRDNTVSVTAAEAITRGLSAEGGLFVPESLPKLTASDWELLRSQSYVDRAVTVLSRFLTDFSLEEVTDCASSAYTVEHFESADIAPIYTLKNDTHILELWHGPTCAFKDPFDTFACCVLRRNSCFQRDASTHIEYIVPMVKCYLICGHSNGSN